MPIEDILHDLDYHITVKEDGSSKGASKGWLTRKHGKDTATRKKHGKFSKRLHDWARLYAAKLQLDKDFRKKHPEDWDRRSYSIAYTIAKKRFK